MASLLAVVLGLTVAVPAGVVAPGGDFPLSWLSWFAARPAWSAAAAFVGVPTQQAALAQPTDHHVSAAVTRAGGGAGRAPKPAKDTLAPYQLHDVVTKPVTTGPAQTGFDSRTSRRLPEQATATSDVYENADGSYTRRTYSRPVNYRAADGSWQPIDPALVRRTDGRLHMTANSVQVSVAGNSAPRSDLARMVLPSGQVVAYRLDGAADVQPAVAGGTATYRNVLPHTDLELATFDAGLKETLVLRSPDAPSSWLFPLRLEGLRPRLTDAGWIELLDAGGKAVAWFPRGSMKDSKVDPKSGAGAGSNNVTFELVTLDGAPALKVTADQAWLRDPARVYPVKVDPTATTGTTGDVFVDNDSTSNNNGDSLAIGTYDGGTTKSRAFIHFDDFGANGFTGKHITGAKLKLYLTWTYDCNNHKPFYVHRVTSAWTVADLTNASYPGPTSISSSIGSLTVADNYPACLNTSGNRSSGAWVTVPLDVSTFNDWSTGGMNEGLALTTSVTDSYAWKRFTAANYNSGAYKPYLEFTYSNNVAPQVNVRYPADNAVVSTLTPELLVRGRDSDNWPNKGLTYNFRVYDSAGTTLIASSGWTSATSWAVPAGKLEWNKSYLHRVQVYDTVSYSADYPEYSFTTSVPQPLLTANLAQNAGKGYDPSIGNYTTSATDASVAVIGPSLSITRSYNSLDPRRANAFGTGWSSVLDARATEVADAAGSIETITITYPTGQDVSFGRNADGTFISPAGRFATLTQTKDAGGAVTGYTLTDKDATVYSFAQPTGSGGYRISSLTDANGRALTFSYDTSGNLSQLTSAASGRALHVTWATPPNSLATHVATVTTDPPAAGGSGLTWTYGYDTDDRLTSVCPPTSTSECTTYTYGARTSQYANAVLNAGPSSYWRLNEAAGASAAGSRVLANAGADNGRYNGVTLGQPAALPDSTSTAAGFDGTSSHVQLPGKLVSDGQYQSISMWFKTTAVNGVLFSYSGDPITNGSTSGNYTPALYIGSDGKLRGEFYMGAPTSALTSAAAVNDGAWHHVALVGMGDTQTLYLDGAAQATLAGTIAMSAAGGTNYVYAGAGYIGGGWPGHASTGASPAVPSYFNGALSDVAFFNQALSGATVSDLYSAGKNSVPDLTKITRPSLGVTAEIAYDTATGKVTSVTDENGGVWTMGTPTVSGNSDVYVASVLGAKPADYWRLGEVEVTDAVNEVQGGTAVYNLVTLGGAGPFADSHAASFDGTTSYLELPADDVPATGPNSVEMWFNMPSGNTSGGVLFGYQNGPMSDLAAATSYVPALYIGTDGKLRGGLWTGAIRSITTTGVVNDGKWHHVVLAAGTASQAMYLDGTLVGTLDYAVVTTGSTYAYVGAGAWSSWPGASGNTAGYFPGTLAEVAYHNSQLSQAQVGSHFQASKQTAPVAITMVSGVATEIPMPVSKIEVTGPKQEKTSYSYDLVNGNRIVAQTDALGNTTKFGYDVGGFGSLVYDPRGVWTQNLQDVRGNTKQTITCQDQAADKCSSVYYTYYPDATTKTLTPDARNDVLLTMRDGRSASETDNAYLTTYGYDTKGNRTTITDALGRVTTTAYTDGTTVAAYDSGFAPAGLPSTVTTPGGGQQTVTYYANGDVAQVTDPAGKVTRYTYDGLGRVLTETEITDTFPDGLTTSYTYDALGRQLTETAPGVTNRVTGAVHTSKITLTYDVDGNVLDEKTEDLTGGDAPRTESHTYNAHGQEASTTDEAGKTTTFEYDSYGRVIKEIEADGGVTRNDYDAEGNLLTTTMEGFTGDPNNPQAPADLVITSKSYDPAGRLASETDAMGWTTSYTYTDNGLLAKTVRTDGTDSFVVEENTYDAGGNVVKQVTNNGATTSTTTYDAAGRQTSTTVDPGGLDRTTTMTYDRDDNVVSTVESGPEGTVGRSEAMYDLMGRVVAETTYTSTALAPVGRWKLDETSGTTAADASGNSPGTASGGLTWSTEHGGSAVFNGTDAEIRTAGPVVDTTAPFSVATWVKLAAKTADGFAITMWGTNGSSAFKLSYNAALDQWYVSMNVRNADGTKSWINVGSATGVPTAGTWTHLAVTVDPASGVITLYVDGAVAGTFTSTAAFNNRAAEMIIGSQNGSSWFNGLIDDVQVYQKAMSAAEVSQVYAGSAPAADAEVIRTAVDVDQGGLANSVTDPNGNTTFYSYDEEGRAVKTTAPAATAETAGQAPVLANAVSWVGYNTFGEVTDSKDPNGNWSVTGYDAAGRMVSQKLPSYTPPGSTTPITPETTRSYDALGQVASVTDPLNNTTSYTYDQLGRVAKVTAPNTGITKYTYDNAGDLLSTTDPTGAVSSATYDYLGRQVTTTQVVRQDGANYTTNYSYGYGGWLSQVTTPAGVVTANTYNPAGETLTVRDGANNTTSYSYDGAGRLAKTTLPDSTYTTSTYDLADRTVATASYNAAGTVLTSQSSRYDQAGNAVATTDARGTTTTYAYDATGVLTRESQPISGSDAIETTFGYDLAGNRTRFTDGRGNAFFTTYNSWGLPESQIEPATSDFPADADRTYTVAYDAAGRPRSQTMPGGVSITNTYDAMGQLTRQVGAGAEAATDDRVFGYDLAGRMTQLSGTGGTNTLTYDDRGLLLSVTGPSGDSSFTYNPDGQMASRVDAAGTTSYGYDTAGRIATAANTGAGVQLGYAYNSLSQVSKITYGGTGNSRNFSFDELHRPVVDELKTPAGTSIAKITYGWDENGNLTSKATTGFAGSASNTYTYDLADRLTSWNDGTATTVYAYDKSGNRVQNGAKLFTYDQRNRLVTADGAGYTYTARGTLATAGGMATVSDAFGQVVSQQSASGTQTYTYDGLGRAIRPNFSYTGLGNDLAGDGTATYVRGTAGELLGEVAGGTQRLAWTDLHTDVVGQFTATGVGVDGSATYDPLGRVVATSGMVGHLGYQSEWTDSLTNRVNMHARWYNTETGQFDSRDTADNSPTPDSINANRYQYGDGNPLTVTDPTGHWGSWFSSAARGLSSAWHRTTSYASHAYSSASSYVSSARSWASEKYQMARSYASKKYNQVKTAVKKTYHKVKQAVKKKYHQIKRAVKKRISQGRKWIAKKYHQAKKRLKQAYHRVRQAGRKIAAAATRVVKKAASQVKDAYDATKKWVKEHKNDLIEVAAIGGAILAGLACTAVTAGAGAVACMVGAGALINLAKDAAQGDIHSVGDALGSVATGALSGLAGGAGGMIAGRVAAAVASRVGTGLMGRLATEAVENGVEGVIDQALTTGRVSPRATLEGMIPGLSLLNRKGGKLPKRQRGGGSAGDGGSAGGRGGGGGGSCATSRGLRHSFDPSTAVLMADGSVRPIADVNVGDRVTATDPRTGRSVVKPVTRLHRNVDRDLTDLTVRGRDGKSSVLKTTGHHPFWDATDRRWVDAAQLKSGHRLLVHDEKRLEGDGTGAGVGGGGPGTVVTVAKVVSYTGVKEMRDLTVADIHTYYVIAGNTPVLVHNNNFPCRNAQGRFERDPNYVPPTHTRDTEYPGGFRQSTHDAMARNWTDEGRAGLSVSNRSSLTWRDETGAQIPFDELTYDHVTPVVSHWNRQGYDMSRAGRNDWYNDVGNLVPMSRSANSSSGARLGQRYRQTTGPNYSG